jgi:hypothetical protein
MLTLNKKRKGLLPLRRFKPHETVTDASLYHGNVNEIGYHEETNVVRVCDENNDDHDDDKIKGSLHIKRFKPHETVTDASLYYGSDYELNYAEKNDVACDENNDDHDDGDYDDDVGEEDDDDDNDDEDYADDSSDGFTDNNVVGNEMLQSKIIGQLKEEGIEIHLHSELVNRSLTTVNTMLNRYAKLFAWFHKKQVEIDADVNVLRMLNDIVLRRFQLLTKYYKYLRDVILSKPSTIYNLNEEVSILLNWFAVFRESRDEHTVQAADLYAVNLVIKAMRKYYSKERRILACKSTSNTVEGLIKSKKWPRGGLKELHDVVLSEMQWARNIYEQNPSSVQDPTVYNRFMQLMLASFYTGIQLNHPTLYLI